MRLPDAAWDCHAHVIGDPIRYPLWSGRNYEPPAASLEAYLALLDRNHLARGVLIQPSCYGNDNRCLLDALDQADGRLLGVVVPAPDSTVRDLEAMHRRGVRGVRCNQLNPGGLDTDVILAWQPVLHSLGWHVSLHIDVDAIADLPALVARFLVPVVIDHMGRPSRLDLASPCLGQLIQLVREGACFVKLSAPYRLSDRGPPWPEVAPLARALLAANPTACVWGSDWPHVHTPSPVNTADIVSALADWCPPEELHALMVETPNRLLGVD